MKKIFLDLDGTLAKFDVENALQRFATEEGFFANLKAYKNIEKVNEIASNGNVYIISASPNKQADRDKIQWVNKHLSNVPMKNIIICRIGENKAKVIENKLNITIDRTTILLDDYTKNLIDWENAGGTGIKRLTNVANNSRGLWKGLAIRGLDQLKGAITIA